MSVFCKNAWNAFLRFSSESQCQTNMSHTSSACHGSLMFSSHFSRKPFTPTSALLLALSIASLADGGSEKRLGENDCDDCDARPPPAAGDDRGLPRARGVRVHRNGRARDPEAESRRRSSRSYSGGGGGKDAAAAAAGGGDDDDDDASSSRIECGRTGATTSFRSTSTSEVTAASSRSALDDDATAAIPRRPGIARGERAADTARVAGAGFGFGLLLAITAPGGENVRGRSIRARRRRAPTLATATRGAPTPRAIDEVIATTRRRAASTRTRARRRVDSE